MTFLCQDRLFYWRSMTILSQDWVWCDWSMTFFGQDWVWSDWSMTFSGQDWVWCDWSITFFGQDWSWNDNGMTFLGEDWSCRCLRYVIGTKKQQTYVLHARRYLDQERKYAGRIDYRLASMRHRMRRRAEWCRKLKHLSHHIPRTPKACTPPPYHHDGWASCAESWQ